MKKLDSKKLRLDAHTVRTLQTADAAKVVGGATMTFTIDPRCLSITCYRC